MLANRDPRLDGIASGFRQRQAANGPGAMLGLLLFFAGLVIVFWLVARTSDRYERPRATNSPWRLFFSLAKVHRLRWSEIWILWTVARRQRLADPARLFLEPERLSQAQQGAASSSRSQTLHSLSKRLFAELQENPSSAQKALVVVGAGRADATRASEASIPLFPAPEPPQLDLPPWNAASGDASSVAG